MVDLTDCDREPIHILGAIQPHGVLLVLTEPALTIAQASDNLGDQLELDAESALGRPLGAVVDPPSVDLVRKALREELLGPAQRLPHSPRIHGQQRGALVALLSHPEALMDLVAADGAAVVGLGIPRTCGRSPPRELIQAKMDRTDGGGYATPRLGRDRSVRGPR